MAVEATAAADGVETTGTTSALFYPGIGEKACKSHCHEWHVDILSRYVLTR